MASSDGLQRPYKCEIDIAFPSELFCKYTKDVLSVDEEINGEKVVKTFSLVSSNQHDGKLNILRVNIEATEAKFLRVAASSFYDMLAVVVKCYQEFGSDDSCEN
jgi:hypothetical protein